MESLLDRNRTVNKTYGSIMEYVDSESTPEKIGFSFYFGVSKFSALFFGVLACALLDRHNTDY